MSYRKMGRGLIYIINQKESDFYKIGLSLTFDGMVQRLKDLNIGNPNQLVIVGVYHTSQPLKIEHHIHLLLRYYRIRGEWFQLPEQIFECLYTLFSFERVSIEHNQGIEHGHTTKYAKYRASNTYPTIENIKGVT